MAQGDVLGFIKNRPGNILINGAFEVNQRFGVTLNSSAGSYGLDRWFFNAGTSVARVAIVGEKFEFAMEAIATALQNNHLQRFEASTIKHFIGKQVTFSMVTKLTSGSISAPLRLKTSFANVKDDFSAITLVDNEPLVIDGALDGTFKKLKFTFTITSDMANKGLELHFGDFGSATNTIQFAHAMLNEGENAPEFERAGVKLGNEIQLCQRYFEKSYNSDVVAGTVTPTGKINVGGNSGGAGLKSWPTKVTMRIAPTMTFYSPDTGNSGVISRGGGDLGTFTSNSGENILHCSTFSGFGNDDWSWHYTADAEL